MSLAHDTSSSYAVRHLVEALASELRTAAIRGDLPTKWACAVDQFPDNGLAKRDVNVLPGRTLSGWVGGKVIEVDEATGTTRAQLVAFGPDGQMKCIDGAGLTVERCGLMAGVALQYVLPLNRGIPRVGFIGSGKICKAVRATLDALYGLGSTVTLLSPRQEIEVSQTYLRHQETHNPNDLSDCAVIVSATTPRPEDPLYPEACFENVPYLIAFDGGFQFGPKLRESHPSFTEDVAGTLAKWKAEFPYDDAPPELKPLHHAKGLARAAFYPYGTGTADLVLASLTRF